MKFSELLTSIGFIPANSVIVNRLSISSKKNTFMYYMIDETKGNEKITVCFNDNGTNSEVLEICNTILLANFLRNSEVEKLQQYMSNLLEQKQAVATVNIFMNWRDKVKDKKFATIKNLENIASGLEYYLEGDPVNDWTNAMLLEDEGVEAGLEYTVIADAVEFS